jgi:hypothetical protein
VPQSVDLLAPAPTFGPPAPAPGVAAVASFVAAVLTEIYLSNACSCPEIFCVLLGGLFD